MAAALSRPPVQPEEQRLLLHGISWAEYEKFVELFDEHRGVHLTYLCGALEIMTTSRRHEVIKKRIARLVEAWSEEKRVDLRGYGSPTFKKAAKERGLRPDECYVIGECEEDIEKPDIAIGVVVSSPLLDKLQVYAGLDVREVWVWRAGVIRAFILEGDRYREAERSELLPELDFALIAELAEEAKQIDAVRALRARL
ncbi:MAG: Uma2 family endonuclease [Polyangiales bacterium]